MDLVSSVDNFVVFSENVFAKKKIIFGTEIETKRSKYIFIEFGD